MNRLTWAVAFTLLFPLSSPAWAQVSRVFWNDPTLAAATRDADLVVLAQAEKVATNGAAYRVQRTLKGPKRDGELLAITGLHHPELRKRPPVSEGDLAYLLLRGDSRGEGFSLPTPTFGRFLRKAQDAIVSLGGPDTFVRIEVPAARFESILCAFATEKRSADLMGWCREVARSSSPVAEELYLALGVLAELGAPEDAAAAARILKAPAYDGSEFVRLRMAAARVLGRTGGERGARTLVALAARKARPAVVSEALAQVPLALGEHPSPRAVRAVCQELAKLTPRLRTKPIRFGQADDPRRNFVDSPLMACLKSIARLGSTAGVGPALRALEQEDFEAIQAGLVYFELLRDAARAADIAERMRPPGHRDVFVNRTFGASLQLLTGQRLGDDRQAWLAWCRAQHEDDAAGPRPPGSGK